MLQVSSNVLREDATIRWEVSDSCFTEDNIKYYDKDGFELCRLEKSYYRIHGYPFHQHLNHDSVWQESWFIREPQTHGLIIDHSMILHRCDFTASARVQIERHRLALPRLDFMLRTRRKWGLDMALDWADSEGAFEVIHIEMDSYDYNETCDDKQRIEEFILKTDWEAAAMSIRDKRDQWESLTGFAQNDWKARYFGFPRAERTQKSG
jgi:hypothetical protein